MSKAPYIFVSAGTLVPDTPSTRISRLATSPLKLAHRLDLGPDPNRFLADSAYGPLKELRNCWVEPLQKLGLASRARSLEAAKTKLSELLDKDPDRQVIVVGQSQGALIASELVLCPRFRGRIVAAVLAGGPFKGSPAIEQNYLKWSKVFPGVQDMTCKSRSLAGLRGRVARHWPAEVKTAVIGAPDDSLVPTWSAFGLEFPKGSDVKTYLTGKVPEAEQEQIRRSLRSHLVMCRHRNVVSLVRELREEFTAEFGELPLAA